MALPTPEGRIEKTAAVPAALSCPIERGELKMTTIGTAHSDHLLRVARPPPSELTELLDLAARMKRRPVGWRETLRGQSVACYFAKPSTRTRVSVEAAVNRLGALPIMLRPDELQLGRGEPISDTARVLSALLRGDRHAHVRAGGRRRGGRGLDGARDQRADRRPSPLPGARGPADAARALRPARRRRRSRTSATATTSRTR